MNEIDQLLEAPPIESPGRRFKASGMVGEPALRNEAGRSLATYVTVTLESPDGEERVVDFRIKPGYAHHLIKRIERALLAVNDPRVLSVDISN